MEVRVVIFMSDTDKEGLPESFWKQDTHHVHLSLSAEKPHGVLTDSLIEMGHPSISDADIWIGRNIILVLTGALIIAVVIYYCIRKHIFDRDLDAPAIPIAVAVDDEDIPGGIVGAVQAEILGPIPTAFVVAVDAEDIPNGVFGDIQADIRDPIPIAVAVADNAEDIPIVQAEILEDP